MKNFNPSRPFIVGQDTKKGFMYWTGRRSIFSPDGWSRDIRKAKRVTPKQWKELMRIAARIENLLAK